MLAVAPVYWCFIVMALLGLGINVGYRFGYRDGKLDERLRLDDILGSRVTAEELDEWAAQR